MGVFKKYFVKFFQNRVRVMGFSGLLQYRFSVTVFALLVADSVERCFMDSTGLRSKNS